MQTGYTYAAVLAAMLLNIRGQTVSIGGGVRYWADSPSGGPEGWGARVVFTLLFPK
jgi:hypothetical protein